MALRVSADCVAGLLGWQGLALRAWAGVLAGSALDVLALWRPGGGGERGEGLASAAPGFRRQAFGGAAGVFLLPGVPGPGRRPSPGRAQNAALTGRVLHAAARLVRGGRRRRLKIQASWPWAEAITDAWQRVNALPQAP